jgi:hypothetical protein
MMSLSLVVNIIWIIIYFSKLVNFVGAQIIMDLYIFFYWIINVLDGSIVVITIGYQDGS